MRLDSGPNLAAVIEVLEGHTALLKLDDNTLIRMNGRAVPGRVNVEAGDIIVIGETTLRVVSAPEAEAHSTVSGSKTKTGRSLSFGLFMALLIVGTALGPSLWAGYEAEGIRELGVSHMGTVVSIEDTKNRINDAPVVLVKVEVDLGDRKVVGEIRQRISPVHLPRVQPGQALKVWIDPADPSRMALEAGW